MILRVYFCLLNLFWTAMISNRSLIQYFERYLDIIVGALDSGVEYIQFSQGGIQTN
jgi:Flp pilus assembly protein TadB